MLAYVEKRRIFMNDTIVAISTALGVGAISIIRVSGNEAINIVNTITKSKKLNIYDSHTIHYDFIVDGEKIIDEVLISIMKAPKTFTKEDVVEINCHGGIATTNKVLELLLTNGCRLAEPGEFTKRAFLNGRIDLMEAEGIMDLIESKTEKSRTLALNAVQGKVSKLITDLRQAIVEILANIEVNIDYPEYEDIEEMTVSLLKTKMDFIENKIKEILSKSENGKLIKEGISVALVGKPNVGKSSLLNCLLEENKAIVTEIAGTTRDCVEGTINLDGIILNIIDTAGIRQTEDIVESIGVKKSEQVLQDADLVLMLLNNNEPLSKEEEQLLQIVRNKKHILVVNKVDLQRQLEDAIFEEEKPIYISALQEQGIDDLKNRIKEMFHFDEIEKEDYTYLTNARALALLRQACDSIQEIKKGIENNAPIDMIEIDLKNVWNLLGNITGETYEEELIDQLFSQFCLGK